MTFRPSGNTHTLPREIFDYVNAIEGGSPMANTAEFACIADGDNPYDLIRFIEDIPRWRARIACVILSECIANEALYREEAK